MIRPSKSRAFAIVLLPLIVTGSLASAGSSEMDFDRGIDVPRVLEMIKKEAAKEGAAAPNIPKCQTASWSLVPMQKARAAVDPREASLTMRSGTSRHNILLNYLSNHQNHRNMEVLLVDPAMDDLDVTLIATLRAKGAGLTQEREGMLPEAKRLDANDTALDKEKKALNEKKAELDVRDAEIERQVRVHEARCLPTHPPEDHQWCVENAARLNKIIAIYNEDVKTHNVDVDEWERKVNVHVPEWNNFVALIRAWEAKIQELIEQINKALSNPRTCSDLRYKELKDRIRNECKVPPISACASGDDCDTLRAKKARFLACAAARDAMNQECFGGGDNGHQDQANQMRNGANNCQPFIDMI